MFEKFKKIVIKEFHHGISPFPKMCFSVAKKAISDFAALKPSPLLLADLMLTLAETACETTYELGDMDEPFYDSAVTNFKRALDYMQKTTC